MIPKVKHYIWLQFKYNVYVTDMQYMKISTVSTCLEYVEKTV